MLNGTEKRRTGERTAPCNGGNVRIYIREALGPGVSNYTLIGPAFCYLLPDRKTKAP